MNANVFIPHPGAKSLNFRHKKTGPVPGFFAIPAERISGIFSARRVGQVVVHALGALQFAERIANDLFGQARALSALGADAGALAHLAIVASTIVDRIADLSIGDTLAEADVHGCTTVAVGLLEAILIIMRMIVKSSRVRIRDV